RLGDGPPTMITKGAFEPILTCCRTVRVDGGVAPFTDEARARATQIFADHTAKGMRVLGVATREVTRADSHRKEDEIEMTFEGFLSFADPPKKGVEKVVVDLAKLGVEIKIVTG